MNKATDTMSFDDIVVLCEELLLDLQADPSQDHAAAVLQLHLKSAHASTEARDWQGKIYQRTWLIRWLEGYG